MRTVDGFERITWDDVEDGDTVWIDNYQDGKFPDANPQVSGPFTVENAKDRQLKTTWKVKFLGKEDGYRTFFHYPNNLLRTP